MRDSGSDAAAGLEIDGEAAWRNLIGSKTSRWTADAADAGFAQTAHARLSAGIALPRVKPKFAFTDDDVFFCIGSCFARNIEEHLMYRGMAVLSKLIAFDNNRIGRPNSNINKFTTGSILNELRWSLAGEAFPPESIVEDDGAWRDLQLALGAPALPLAQAQERRASVSEYFGRIREATVVIITLGLVEAWYDSEASVLLNVAPTLWMTRRFPGRFCVRVTDHAANLAALRAIYDLLGRYADPRLRVIVTVSPVPMGRTFTGQDVILANTYSKSTLRAAAEDSTRGRDGIQYYPSYETITVSNRARTFNPADEMHVLDTAVEMVTTDFLRTYGIARERPHPEFVEMDYLYANPDVHDAVRRMQFVSGYEHWLAYGRGEGRPLRAEHRSPQLDRLLG